jgi:hypothetical protein
MNIDGITDSLITDSQFGKGVLQNSLTPLGWGLDRFVFRIEAGTYARKVLKVARKDMAVSQNHKELRTWRRVEGTDLEKYFCPIVIDASDMESYRYLVMEAAEETQVPRDKRLEFMNAIDILGIPLDDFSQGNLGYYNGNLVVIDYPAGKF